jgi:hypothetical protein
VFNIILIFFHFNLYGVFVLYLGQNFRQAAELSRSFPAVPNSEDCGGRQVFFSRLRFLIFFKISKIPSKRRKKEAGSGTVRVFTAAPESFRSEHPASLADLQNGEEKKRPHKDKYINLR